MATSASERQASAGLFDVFKRGRAEAGMLGSLLEREIRGGVSYCEALAGN